MADINDADIVGYARLTKVGNKVRTFYSYDRVTWNLSDQVDVIGDFDIFWPILIKKEESDEQT